MRRKPAVLLIKDDQLNTWSAHFLEYPIFAQAKPGEDKNKALFSLKYMVIAYAVKCVKNNQEVFPINYERTRWPDHDWHDLFHNGEMLPVHEIEIDHPMFSLAKEKIHLDCLVVEANQVEENTTIRS